MSALEVVCGLLVSGVLFMGQYAVASVWSRHNRRTRISVAMAAHNEEKYLPYALGSLKDASISELVVCLDHCTDRSRQIVKDASLRCEKKIVELGAKSWRNPTAEPFAAAAAKASGDVVYVLGADIYADKTIFTADWNGMDVCSWSLQDYPLHAQNSFFLQILRGAINVSWERIRWRMKGLSYGTGVYAYRKTVYQQIQHRDVDSEDWRFLKDVQEAGFRLRFKRSRCLHLRPYGKRNLQRKAEAAAMLGVPVWKAIWQGIKLLSPKYFRRYCATRHALQVIRDGPVKRRHFGIFLSVQKEGSK